MGDCEDPDGIREFKIHNVVGKPIDWDAADGEILWDIGNGCASLGPTGNVIERAIHGSQKRDAESVALALIPKASVFEFGGGLKLRAKREAHRCARRRATRWRTSAQGSPSEFPASTRRARVSISRAHAAWALAASAGAASSRLTSSSAITSARSSCGKVSASRRTCCARVVMGHILASSQSNTRLHPTAADGGS